MPSKDCDWEVLEVNRSLLPEPKRLLPMLEQIAAALKFVDIARQRALSMAERIRHQR